MATMKILVTFPLEASDKSFVEQIARTNGFRLVFSTVSTVTEKEVSEADIILGNIPDDFLAHADRLKWYQMAKAGADKTLASPYMREDIILTCGSGAFGPAVAEHMLASLLALMKNLPQYAQQQKKAEWKPITQRRGLHGAHVLIVGYGDLGSAFARMVLALGAHVTGVRRRPVSLHETLDPSVQVIGFDNLDSYIPEADVVALCLPATPQTYHLFSREKLLAMKKDAYIVNGGRGDAIDVEELAAVLEAGHLAGAALDVTEPEPLPIQHPLWKAPRLLLTPHVAGGYGLPHTRETIGRIMVDNLKRFLEGQPLTHTVDRVTGYRSKD